MKSRLHTAESTLIRTSSPDFANILACVSGAGETEGTSWEIDKIDCLGGITLPNTFTTTNSSIVFWKEKEELNMKNESKKTCLSVDNVQSFTTRISDECRLFKNGFVFTFSRKMRKIICLEGYEVLLDKGEHD